MKTELAWKSDSSVDNNSIVPPPVKSEETANSIIHRRVVKKEDDGNNENKETQILPRRIDDNYDDWRNGNWCWLLSSANDKSNAMNKTRHSKSVVSYTTNHSGASENGDTKNTPNNNIAATTTTGILVTGTSTTRHQSYDDDGKNNDDEKMKPSPKKKMRHCRQQPINYNDREEEGGEVEDSVYEYNANNPISNNNNNSSSSSSSSSSNEGDDEEGYESWTKGNWCWLLPYPTTVDNIKTGRPSTRRIHMGVNIGGDNPYEDGDSGNEDHDTDADTDTDTDNDVSSAKSKTRKDKMQYTTWQNKKWDELFRRLVAYKKENKTTNVPREYQADPKLGQWVRSQRAVGTNKNISEERIRRLNSIGFVWKIEVPWMEMYQKLVAYKKKHKSTIVPREYHADPRLGNWINKQRKWYNKKELHIDRINHLESIGFVWNAYDMKWMEIYYRLVAYKMQHDSTVVPYHCTEDPSLGAWVYTQRVVYNQGKLSGKRLKLLNSINFIWSAKKAI